jgi:hypothetical protein
VNVIKVSKLKNLLYKMAFISITNQDMVSSNTRLLTLSLKMSNILYKKLIICISSL